MSSNFRAILEGTANEYPIGTGHWGNHWFLLSLLVFTKAPPLFPGFTAASVWMKDCIPLLPKSLALQNNTSCYCWRVMGFLLQNPFSTFTYPSYQKWCTVSSASILRERYPSWSRYQLILPCMTFIVQGDFNSEASLQRDCLLRCIRQQIWLPEPVPTCSCDWPPLYP
jgi:hypothetical protein